MFACVNRGWREDGMSHFRNEHTYMYILYAGRRAYYVNLKTRAHAYLCSLIMTKKRGKTIVLSIVLLSILHILSDLSEVFDRHRWWWYSHLDRVLASLASWLKKWWWRLLSMAWFCARVNIFILHTIISVIIMIAPIIMNINLRRRNEFSLMNTVLIKNIIAIINHNTQLY